ncbi:lysozyme inhibitor LprI family protein [Limnobaculum parvum]|nr:lysozyme inhibitor LprI family protein [Limnobaculum parvum]
MKSKQWLYGIVFSVFSLNVYAELDCNNAMNTLEINACAEQEQQKVEQKLNQTYKAVMQMMSQPDLPGMSFAAVKKDLLESQRAWITFRKKDCDALYDFYIDGSIRNVVYISCMKKHAERRIDDLDRYLSGSTLK